MKKLFGTIVVVTMLALIAAFVGCVIWFQGGCGGRDKNFVRESSTLRPLLIAPFDRQGYDGDIRLLQGKIEALMLEELPLGASVAEVEWHIGKHFTIKEPPRFNDWYTQGKWHFRFDAIVDSECFSSFTARIGYEIDEGKLERISVNFSGVAL